MSFVSRLKESTNAAMVTVARASRAVWDFRAANRGTEAPTSHLRNSLSKLDAVLDTILDALHSERWGVVNPRNVLVTGPAGVGKSHLFGDAVDHQVQQGRPAVLILGGTLIDDDIWAQIVKQLDLKITTEAFLGAMDAAAQATVAADVIYFQHGIANAHSGGRQPRPRLFKT